MKGKAFKHGNGVFSAIILTLLLGGCVKLALRISPDTVPNITRAVFEECDHDLAELSIPADLKLLEGILKEDPDNPQILTSLSMGFAGYSMLFIEEDDPVRASALYLRARDYGLRALGNHARILVEKGAGKEKILRTLKEIDGTDIEALFWTTLSWNAWINLNLDKPAALAQLGTAEACLKRVMDIEPDYFYGAPYILEGTILAAKPRMLGGNEAEAKKNFHRAMESSQGTFFLTHYFFAKHYAVRVQDKELFLALIDQVETSSPDILREACLINSVMKQKMRRLKLKVDELFL